MADDLALIEDVMRDYYEREYFDAALQAQDVLITALAMRGLG